jgi:hypothetical protein
MQGKDQKRKKVSSINLQEEAPEISTNQEWSERASLYFSVNEKRNPSNTTMVLYFFTAGGRHSATCFDRSCRHLLSVFLQENCRRFSPLRACGDRHLL